jgi:hypothetical protein
LTFEESASGARSTSIGLQAAASTSMIARRLTHPDPSLRETESTATLPVPIVSQTRVFATVG